MAGKIFISYRRSDSKAITDRIYSWLAEQFGRDAVFYDIDTIGPGVDWRTHIREEVGKARVVLAIISATWLAEMQARAADPQDVLRFELETALAHGISVVPVLIERTEMPRAGALPASLVRLPDLNAATVHEARYFFTDMEALAERLAAAWGLKRRTPDVKATSTAVATADLVVASRFSFPILPPPKVGEHWDVLTWPKKIYKSWMKVFSRVGNIDNAAWIITRYGQSPWLAICSDSAWIGFVDFADKDVQMEHPFTFREYISEKVPTGRIYHMAANGEAVVFTARGMLCRYEKSGYREDLSIRTGARPDAAQGHLLSAESNGGLWVHMGDERIESNDPARTQDFFDVYRGAERLKRIARPDGAYCGYGDGRFVWSPTGAFAILSSKDSMTGLVAISSIDAIQFEKLLKHEGGEKRYVVQPLPGNNDWLHRHAAWHPTRDVFAIASYRHEKQAMDWHVAIYDAVTRTLLHGIPVDEPREIKEVAWNATGRYIAAGGDGRCIFVLDLLTGTTKRLFGHSNTIASLHFSPDGQRLLSSGGGLCIVWSPETGERIASWTGSVSYGLVRECPWSPDAQMVATSRLEVRRLAI